MDYEIDLKKLVSCLKKDKSQPVPEYIETDGERYIFENVIQKFASNSDITMDEIDLDAFEEDDITTLIDDKSDFIEDTICTVYNLVKTFSDMTPARTKTRQFF